MNSFLSRSIFVLMLLFSISYLIKAQQVNGKEHKSIIDYRIVQYISTMTYDPVSTMRLDNNGELILACKHPKTKEELSKMNINVITSQIRLLELYNLLTVENGILTTAFPILDENQMGQIRKSTKQLAPELADFIEGDVKELSSLIKEMNWKNNAYSILFAYIVDGIVWNDFYDRDLIHARSITKEHPFWAGQVWAFLPEREFSCGTNSSSVEDYMLVVNWSHNAYPTLGLFSKEKRKLDENSFVEFARNGRVNDEKIKETFMPFGIFDESGKLLIPVIEENNSNELYRISRRISQRIAGRVPELLSFEDLSKEYNFRDTEQSLIIIYHELMWDLMDELTDRGLIEKPVLFSHPDDATPKNVADLVFIVHKPEN